MWEYPARLDRVVDGDTVDLIIDLGFDVQAKVRVRVRGVDCPERNTDAGREAQRYTQDWFALALAKREDWPVIVTTGKQRATRSFIRYVADVKTADGEHDLGSDLLLVGYAEPMA